MKQRNDLREEFLNWSQSVQKTRQWLKLKAYLKLVCLTNLEETSPPKLMAQINHMITSGETEKLINVLSLPQAKSIKHFSIAAKIISQLENYVGWCDLVRLSQTDGLGLALTQWPEFRKVCLQVLRIKLNSVTFLEEIDEVVSVILAQIQPGRLAKEVFTEDACYAGEILSSLDQACISSHYKSYLLMELKRGLEVDSLCPMSTV
eukprot:TRINITY_DN26597_c0_g1_i1.p1 TRINITY_DN26597_c0_g1~~TRINITY_DN26597_c0_g1_i1.p1  ORF type:complete len:205 (-),score=6.76 TRINITY_DN26597_c0_g1_i1:200-814(-)